MLWAASILMGLKWQTVKNQPNTAFLFFRKGLWGGCVLLLHGVCVCVAVSFASGKHCFSPRRAATKGLLSQRCASHCHRVHPLSCLSASSSPSSSAGPPWDRLSKLTVPSSLARLVHPVPLERRLAKPSRVACTLWVIIRLGAVVIWNVRESNQPDVRV